MTQYMLVVNNEFKVGNKKYTFIMHLLVLKMYK